MNPFDLKSPTHVLEEDPTQGHLEVVTSASAVEEMSLTIWNTIKRNPLSIAYSLLVVMGAMVYRYDLVVVGLI